MAHKERPELLSDLEKLKAHIKVGDAFLCPGFPKTESGSIAPKLRLIYT